TAAGLASSCNHEIYSRVIRSTTKIAINPTEDVSDITATCLNRLPCTNFACCGADIGLSKRARVPSSLFKYPTGVRGCETPGFCSAKSTPG
ncbi:MAG: hypothetical protein CFE34_15765, partial [Rhodobacteraceae bacterium PARR1]